tara:strand:- start:805 stop:1518 length:714 start_codon:yes stop_codon:yes gene_type:complete
MPSVFITGASSDIGLAVANRYLENGYRLFGHYRTNNPTLQALAEHNENVHLAKGDFSTPEDLEDFISENCDHIQACDVLINVASGFFAGGFQDLNAETFFAAIKTNAWPTFRLIQELAPHMQSRRWGRIVNIGSIGVKFRGGSNSFNYAISKHLIEFMPCDYKGWASDNVFINTLRVGVTDTKFHDRDPSKRLSDRAKMIPAAHAASTDDIARAVYFYGSDQNGFATGETVAIAGGE